MKEQFIDLTTDNIENEHLCCAIADKKHQAGVDAKREWLKDRIGEGHTFRKLNEKGKVFIEYAPLETAWVPVDGADYVYIYCLWVSGSFSGRGYGKALLQYCIDEAKRKGKAGICAVSSKKKKPFLSDKKFLQKHGFQVVDEIGGEYELLALPFDTSKPYFRDNARKQAVNAKALTVYYGLQCPYIPNCIEQIESYCDTNGIDLNLVKIDTLEKAKNVPGVFNNWAVFRNGAFETVHLLNEGHLKKMLEK